MNNQLIKRIIFIAGILMTTIHGFSQGISAQASLDTSQILIGQQVTLKVKLDMPAGKNVVWPVLSDSIAPGIELLNPPKIDTVFSEDKKTMSLIQRMRITSFDTGMHVIPPFRFFEKGKDTLKVLAQSEQLLLNVRTVEADTAKPFKDVKSPMGIPYSFREIAPWVAGGIVLLAVIWLIIRYILKRRRHKPLFEVPVKPKQPAYVIALEEIEKLRVAKLWQNGRIKEYHTQLTEIVRVYIERQFNVMALEMTTDEVMENLSDKPIDRDARIDLKSMLQMADLVKFAKANPLPDEHDDCMKKAIEFIQKTKTIQDNSDVARN